MLTFHLLFHVQLQMILAYHLVLNKVGYPSTVITEAKLMQLAYNYQDIKRTFIKPLAKTLYPY